MASESTGSVLLRPGPNSFEHGKIRGTWPTRAHHRFVLVGRNRVPHADGHMDRLTSSERLADAIVEVLDRAPAAQNEDGVLGLGMHMRNVGLTRLQPHEVHIGGDGADARPYDQ